MMWGRIANLCLAVQLQTGKVYWHFAAFWLKSTKAA